MQMNSRVVAGMLCAVLAVAPAMAQQAHVLDEAAIEKALSERLKEDDADREAIRALLRRPEVRELVKKAPLDLQRAEAAVATLEGSELQALASSARAVTGALSGGQSKITLSTTTIIIGLLVLILIIVAV